MQEVGGNMRLIRTALPALAIVALIALLARTAYAVGPSISLPPGQVDMSIYFPHATSYIKTTLYNVPAGYHVSSGSYDGWCVDEGHNIYYNPDPNHPVMYKALLYSSYDPLNKYRPLDPNWNKVNYILNHKQGTADDVQAAIWHYINHNSGNQNDPEVLAMKADADAHGAGFVPAPGEKLAVVVWIGSEVQTTFIEVCVPPQNIVPEWPVGTVLGGITLVAGIALFKYKPSIPGFSRIKNR